MSSSSRRDQTKLIFVFRLKASFDYMKLTQFVFKPILILLKAIGLLVLVLVAVNCFLTLVVSPVYNFPETQPFNGSVWHNPYDEVDEYQWRLGNFQIQSAAWGGLTNGQNNPSDRVFDVYKRLGYEVITISDYMKINDYHPEDIPLVPVYEHGYGIQKTHQVCIGARSVVPLDYPLFQTLNSKQYILEQLSATSDLVAIAHPSVRNAYRLTDMEKLTHVELIEALSNFQHSIAHWDAALSAGRPLYLLANDDTHNLDNPFDYGKVATVLHCDTISTETVVTSLRKGTAYGLLIHTPENENHERKFERFQDLPHLNAVTISGDSLTVSADRPIREVRFVGQGGQVREIVAVDSVAASYVMTADDTYIRAEITIDPGHIIYTNPVYRTENGLKPTLAVATINWPLTLLYRAGFMLLLAVPLTWLVRRLIPSSMRVRRERAIGTPTP